MAYQRKLAGMIREVFGLSKDDCKSTPAGVNGPDLTLSTQAQRAFPYSLEAKYCRTISLPQWIRQAKEGSYPNTTPIVAFHEFSTKEDYVVLPLSHFISLAAPDLLRPCSDPANGWSGDTEEPDNHPSTGVCSPADASQTCVR